MVKDGLNDLLSLDEADDPHGSGISGKSSGRLHISNQPGPAFPTCFWSSIGFRDAGDGVSRVFLLPFPPQDIAVPAEVPDHLLSAVRDMRAHGCEPFLNHERRLIRRWRGWLVRSCRCQEPASPSFCVLSAFRAIDLCTVRNIHKDSCHKRVLIPESSATIIVQTHRNGLSIQENFKYCLRIQLNVRRITALKLSLPPEKVILSAEGVCFMSMVTWVIDDRRQSLEAHYGGLNWHLPRTRGAGCEKRSCGTIEFFRWQTMIATLQNPELPVMLLVARVNLGGRFRW